MEETQSTAQHIPAPVDPEEKGLWEQYLQKCCEAGQLSYHLTQVESQKNDLQKKLEVTEREVKKAAAAHRDYQQKKYSKLKPAQAEAPKLEMTAEASH